MGMMLANLPELQPAVFAVTMACIDPEYEAQSLDFIREGKQLPVLFAGGAGG